MATAAHYVGQRFGTFVIRESIGHGAEAEVFACQNEANGVVYALRLGVADEELWTGAPIVPPRNAGLEVANAKGTWLAAPNYYLRSLSKLKRDPSAWEFEVPAIYGVLAERYVIPVACPIRVRSSWDVDTVLATSRAEDVRGFAFWEELVLTMISGAYEPQKPRPEWYEKWGPLLGGEVLRKAMTSYLRDGDLTSAERTRVIERVGHVVGTPELAENVLLRLCGSLARGRMSLDEFRATLRCIHFRRNVTEHEAAQMIAAANALNSNRFGSHTSLSLVNVLFEELSARPLDPFKDSDSFEIREEQPELGRFKLFLQELAGHKDVIMLVPPQEAT